MLWTSNGPCEKMVTAQNNPLNLPLNTNAGTICIPLCGQTDNWSIQLLWSVGTVESLCFMEGLKYEYSEKE